MSALLKRRTELQHAHGQFLARRKEILAETMEERADLDRLITTINLARNERKPHVVNFGDLASRCAHVLKIQDFAGFHEGDMLEIAIGHQQALGARIHKINVEMRGVGRASVRLGSAMRNRYNEGDPMPARWFMSTSETNVPGKGKSRVAAKSNKSKNRGQRQH